MKYLTCSFFGHRKIEITEELQSRLESIIKDLILDGCNCFIFGSRSQFNDLCYEIVTKLQKEHLNIKRISYNTKSECVFTSREEAKHFEDIMKKLYDKEIHYNHFECSVDSNKSIKANRNAYIGRNQEMIDNSDICIFYYDQNYLPPKRKYSKRNLCEYQPQSGTAIAYNYAKQKKKNIINVFNFK